MNVLMTWHSCHYFHRHISPLKAQNSDVLKGAFQFIMLGDTQQQKNWKFEAEGCLIKFIQKGTNNWTMVYNDRP